MGTTMGSSVTDRIRASLTPSGGADLWALGEKCNWPELEARLRVSGVEDLWITDKSSEDCFDLVRRTFDGSRCGSARLGILHVLGAFRHDNEDLMCRLLALGLDPGLKDDSKRSPIHHCSVGGAPRSAEALSFCRPDLTALNRESHTPLDLAENSCELSRNNTMEREFYEKVRDTYKLRMSDAFPSPAQLAFEQKWYAIKNLCRRRAVKLCELRSMHQGKDVVQWAEVHGQPQLAEEIRYLFKYPVDGVSRPLSQFPPSVVNRVCFRGGNKLFVGFRLVIRKFIFPRGIIVVTSLISTSQEGDVEIEETSAESEEVAAVTASRVTNLEDKVKGLETFECHVGAVEHSVQTALDQIRLDIESVRSLFGGNLAQNSDGSDGCE